MVVVAGARRKVRFGCEAQGYTDEMTSTEILERVLSWPEERQAKIMRAMEMLERSGGKRVRADGGVRPTWRRSVRLAG